MKQRKRDPREAACSDPCHGTGLKVKAVESTSGSGNTVQLEDGSSVSARRGVVVATDGPTAQQLLGKALSESPSKPEAAVGTCCLYFRWTTLSWQ